MFFEQKVDKRSRKAMIDFLSNHYRYDTMSSWNQSTSYANCVKLHRLGLTSEQLDAAYEMSAVDYWDEIRSPIDDFTRSQNGYYTIGSNGRCSGYLVLYRSCYEASDHKSYCRSCGQKNFKRVLDVKPGTPEAIIAQKVIGNGACWHTEVYLEQSEIKAIDMSDDEKLNLIRRFKTDAKWSSFDNKCGACGATGERGRVNYSKPLQTLATYPGKSIDMDDDFEEWSMDALRERVDLICAFDRACDEIRQNFIDLLEGSEVVEEVVMVPTKVKTIQPRA